MCWSMAPPFFFTPRDWSRLSLFMTLLLKLLGEPAIYNLDKFWECAILRLIQGYAGFFCVQTGFWRNRGFSA